MMSWTRVGRSGRRCCIFWTMRVRRFSRGSTLTVSHPNLSRSLYIYHIRTSNDTIQHSFPSQNTPQPKTQNHRLPRPRRPRRIHRLAPKQTPQEIPTGESDRWIIPGRYIPIGIIVSGDRREGSASLILFLASFLLSLFLCSENGFDEDHG